MTLHLILAQQIPPDVAGWLTGSAVSVLAFGIIAFVKGWIVAGHVYQRALDHNDKQAAELDRLHEVFEDKVIPALTRSTDLMARTAERERTG